ncbi:gp437 [Bacillus phage G]|uniref:Gp437 n=1 Tax=Bacillus phage G TaxID=2884420 RepID=G3MAH8_9CAUD|nr:gp437 [Bacillus phage G]AEO93695.1 gp437 [Bacillus phage G]
MHYEETKKDLFTLPTDYVLAHCIATDARMGAGIAVEFAKRYGGLRPKLQNMDLAIGDVILYKKNILTHQVLNLITKKYSTGKPTRDSFNQTILNLKKVVLENNIKKIGMPLIGSGLDRLSWSESRNFIQETFKDIDVEIIVCKL